MIQDNNIQQMMFRLAGGFLLLLAPACVSEVDINEKQPLVVTAEIASAYPSTRVIGATNFDKRSFEVDDEIQISDGSKNVKYRNDETNGWIPSLSGTGLTIPASSTFSASYPEAFAEILEAQDASYENFWKSNKLEATGLNVTLTNNRVNFIFKPVAAKITISINYTSSGGGVATKYKDVTATLVGNGIRTGSSSSQTIKMLRTSTNELSDKHAFVCILHPGEKSFKLTVSRTDNSSSTTTQTFNQTSFKFEAATNHVYNFTSSDELILNSVTVEGFSDSLDVPQDPVSAT